MFDFFKNLLYTIDDFFAQYKKLILVFVLFLGIIILFLNYLFWYIECFNESSFLKYNNNYGNII